MGGCFFYKRNIIMNARKEKFIKRANELHNNKYDYSKVIFIDRNIVVEIVCPIHDVFEQKPKNHLKGHGCQKCGVEKRTTKLRSTKEEFVNKSIIVHNNFYDYSKVIYIDTHTNVDIICPEHGDFPQTPDNHLRGSGCPDCAGKNKTTESFIKEVNIIHNNKYDYSKFIYTNALGESVIICPIHGEFLQSATGHSSGRGCKQCGIKKFYSSRILTSENFRDRANIIHNNFYIYPLDDYKRNNINIKIICPIHGSFEQRPDNHLMGKGCKQCGIEKAMNSVIDKYGEIWKGLSPRYNPNSIIYLDILSERLNIHILHALNGGEKKFKRYFVDGYISEHNVCIEWDDKGHDRKKRKEKDLIRENYIKENFGCRFVRINEKEFLNDIDNQINIIVDKINEIINL
jgi:very-short-patch-repair endonuclease